MTDKSGPGRRSQQGSPYPAEPEGASGGDGVVARDPSEPVEGNTDAAVEFLAKWAPDGPWRLTAIDPDRKARIATRHFEDIKDTRGWVDQYNGRRNLYFHVNPVRDNRNKKAEREDIASLAFLHVDLDARAGEDLEEERARTLGLLTDKLPDGVPAPTCIIMSGGGAQGFWRLTEPVPIDGDLEKAEQAKLWNVELEGRFRADNCHNVDRVMRLPGTVNIPDAKKRKKGRVPALAELVEFNDNTYPIEQFRAARSQSSGNGEAPRDGAGGGGIAPVRVAAIKDLAELDRWNVPDRVKAIINHGRIPNEPKEGDDSRSAWLFDAVCNLLRYGVPEPTILGIITDPAWLISESVLELGGKAERYARRQITEAREIVADEPPPTRPLAMQIEYINSRYLAALTGGKVRFWRENTDGTLEPMDKTAFLFELATVRHRDDDDGSKPTAPAWLNDGRRRYYPRGFLLDPDAGHDGPAYNLWRGFATQPAPGDWSLMQDHILNVLANGETMHADYITRWCAWAFQNPATPPRVALVFRGGEGVGKGIFARALVELFGVHGMRVQNMAHLTGKFNAHLRHLCMLFADEAVVPNTDGEGALKGLITEPTIPIEAKGVDVVNAENHLHVVMATNNEWAVPAATDARRFAVFDVSEGRRGDHEYFASLGRQMANGGLPAMLHDMLEMDLSGFHPEADRPETKALNRQRDLSLPAAGMAIHNMLMAGEPPCDFEAKPKKDIIFISTLLLANEAKLDQRDQTALGRMLRAVVGEGAKSERQYLGTGRDRRQHRGYWLPSLSLARQHWQNHLGREVEWPADVTSWAIGPKEESDESPF